jgi:type II secretion system protein C
MSAMLDLSDPASDAGQEFLDRLRRRAFSCHERGELEAAESAYLRILERSPADVAVRRALGDLALQTGKHRWALQLFSQVAEFEDTADLQAQMGAAYCGLSRLADALRCYERAIAAQFDHLPARLHRAQVLQAMGRREEAASAYVRTIELGFDDAVIHTLLGVTLGELGRTEASVASFERALALQPDYVPAHVNLGIQLRKLKSDAEALALRQPQPALDSRSFEALVNSAAALVATGNFEAALEAAECAIALRPDAANDAYPHKQAAIAGIQRQEEARRARDSSPSGTTDAAIVPEIEARPDVDAPSETEARTGGEALDRLMATLPAAQAPAAVTSPPDRANARQRLDWAVLLIGAAPTAATLILSALLGSELARGAMALLARGSPTAVTTPAPVRARPPAFDVQPIVNAHLFGQVQQNQESAPATPANANLKLTGTLATDDPHRGIAIIGEPGKSQIYSVGESLDGASLSQVYRDHVILERNGSFESLFLPRALAPKQASATPKGPRVWGKFETNSPIDANAGFPLGIRVVPGADRARFMNSGLMGGDIVVAVNGAKFDSDADGDIWKHVPSGSTVTVLRRGVLKDITLNNFP